MTRANVPSDLWAKVDRSGGPTACWPYLEGRTAPGWHGRMSIKGRMVVASRIAWEIANGPIPDGLSVLHRCDNPPCCNPVHLFLGTQRDNMRDAAAKGHMGSANRNRTHCKRGHPFDGHRDASGRRYCYVCVMDRQRVIRARPEQRAMARERTRLWKAARRDRLLTAAAEAAEEALA